MSNLFYKRSNRFFVVPVKAYGQTYGSKMAQNGFGVMDRQVHLHGEVSIEKRIETGKREMYLHCLNFQFKTIATTLFEEINSSTSIFYLYLTSSYFKVFTVLYHRFSLMKFVFMERFKNKRWILSCFISASEGRLERNTTNKEIISAS